MKRKIIRWIGALSVVLCLLVPLTALADSTGTVTGNGVNLRKGPSTSYARIGVLYRGNTVTVTGQSGAWYKVTTASGTSGYVYGSYVSINSTSSDNTSENVSSSTLKRGSTGAAVKQLQGNLIMLGYLNDTADGIFGAKTESAVAQYQRRNGLTSDGLAGSKTTSAIGSEVVRINKIIDTAKKYLGTDYVYGGSTPQTGFDCSGLTQYSFGQAGITIPRVSYEQAAGGRSVPRSQIRIGDIVAFNSPVSHVGIYIGNNKFIHSPKTGDVVKITDLKYMNLTAIRRYTGVLAFG